MDYEEKYKSALKWMQSLYGGLHGATKEEAEKYFTELKEPNDERIRKELIAIFSVGAKVNAKTGDIPDRDIVAWLEKQGEHKPYGQRKECEDCQFNYAGECKGYCALKRNEQPTDKVGYPRWISVKDELPEACVAVLTTTQNGTQRVGCYEDGWWLANSPDLVRMVSITHWMPLPQPPAVLSSLERAGKKWEEKKGGEQ